MQFIGRREFRFRSRPNRMIISARLWWLRLPRWGRRGRSGSRRRRALDRGFVLSDHADWPALLSAIEATGAEKVWTVHGYRAPLARWLEEHGKAARAVDLPRVAVEEE